MGISIGIAGIHAGNIDHYFHAASVGVLLVARERALRSSDSSAVTSPRAGPLRWGPVEERAVPMSEIGSCGIGGLNEGKHGLIG
jgi:hypothetical protein